MSARLTAEQRQHRAILEADWQAFVLRLATAAGWHSYAPPRAGVAPSAPSARRPPGTPTSRSAAAPTRLRRLKREIGRVTPEQQAWLDRLETAGAEVYVFRPSDLPAVRETLR